MAYTKTINGRDYVIIRGYKRHLKTLMAGNIWRANNPQVVQLGLGQHGMRNVLRVTLVVDIIFAVAINAVDTIVQDENTMVDFVGGSGADIAKGVMATGAGVGAAKLIAVATGGSVLATGAIFAVSIIAAGLTLQAIDDHYGISEQLTEKMKEVIGEG